MQLRPGPDRMARNRARRYYEGAGFSQKESARELAVDPSTLAKWEQGKREPAGAFFVRVKRFLQDGEMSGARRAG
jgi:transcriptional regulator with XRE-family HTH domain